MDAEKVGVLCDMLCDLIGAGPGDNPDVRSKALAIVRSLRAAAEWEYPRQILEDVNVRLAAWFSERQWQGDDAELRHSLLQHVDKLPLSWEQTSATNPTQGATLR